MIDRSLSHFLGKRKDFQVEEMTFGGEGLLLFVCLFTCLFVCFVFR